MDDPVPADPLIAARGLRRTFGRIEAVAGVDLAVHGGEIFGFLGPNGAGKTTTLRMLAGLLTPGAGEVRIAGLDPFRDGREARRITGFVPDTPPLYEHLTARQHVDFVGELWDARDASFDGRADALLRALELFDRRHDLLKGFSHGMRKKTHLAAVLATRPRALLLDEPTNGLDPRSARRLKDLLLDVARDGVAVLLSTHLLETAEEIGDRIGILVDGALRAEGTAAELRDRHGGGTLEEVFLALTAERTGGGAG